MPSPSRRCTGTNKQGEPCGAAPLKDRDVCLAHVNREERDATGFGVNGGRPKKPRVVDVIRERIEGDLEPILAPLFEALTATRGISLAVKGGGMEIGYVPDHETRIKAARELLDRAYGRPKQQTEISGPEGEPVVVELPTADAWHSQVAQVLAEVGAVTVPAMNGNGNGSNGHGPDSL